MGEEPLARLGVPFGELALRQVKLFKYFVKIVYGSHLEITSIVGTSSFALIPRDHSTLFTGVRGREILRTSPVSGSRKFSLRMRSVVASEG
jgi:hypothetical protein